MKGITTIAILFCWSATLLGQTITVSEEISLRNDAGYELIGDLRGNMLLFRDRNTEYEVQSFDERLQPSWSKTLELDKKFPKVIKVIGGKTDFTVLYHFRQKGHTVLKAHRYDPAANLIDSATIMDYGYLFSTPGFEVVRSDDKTKAIVFYIEKQNIIRACALDLGTLDRLWEKSFSLSDFYYGMDEFEVTVDNDGRMFLIIERNNYKSKRKQHYYEVVECSGDPMQADGRYQVMLEDKLTYDVYFSYDNLNKRLVGAGLYYEKNLERAEGYFYLSIDPQQKDGHLLRFEPFDDTFIATLLGKENVKNKGVSEVNVQEVVLRRDGGVLIIIERNRQMERRSGTSNHAFYDNGARAVIDYYFDELIVISVHPTGETHWKSILHKKQYSQDDNGIYSSYFLFKTPGNLRFLFNDEIRQENTVSEYVLNALGEYNRKGLLSTEHLDLKLRFKDAVQVDANAVVVPSERRNRLKLMKLVY
ncbi:MAG: hypothetical protein SH848_15240 [Saprospiraceae bacterium]|nr:hypothetical protein [Saprospiraceae bacterium]MDZ4705278.1 hypothetical protein [Saprospiraceae bacterium]